jgi:predicted CXXCH cytochrome family protein
MVRGWSGTMGTLVAALLLQAVSLGHFAPPVGTAKTTPPANPDAVCARCHQAIYDRYEQTNMARASGPVADGLLQGGFTHQPSGVEYKVFLRGNEALMSYARPSSGLGGERRLSFFVGSGHRGRTYLYEEEGLWFEAPINYYSKKEIWDMAPNFGNVRAMPDGLPVDSNCLHCHATEVQQPLPGARNRYATVPFKQGGIGCSACHGDASAHLAGKGLGPIVNPAKLMPARRDSVCLQCHLEGDTAIYRPGKSLTAFRAGEDLSDYVNYFVKEGAEAGGGRAASQYEALLRSKCKIASGDVLTCTTCHDPHGSPPESERVSFYRQKCLTCHTGEQFAVKHHPEQQDCAVCHMPTRATTDISHEQTTDHNIQRRPAASNLHLASLGENGSHLVPVGNVKPGDREFGLAYEQTGMNGNREAQQMALKLLLRAEASGADDIELHTQLGLIYQFAGQPAAARKEYDRVLALDASNNTALGNKAVLEAGSGHTATAASLLKQVVANDPSQVAAGLNLALIQCLSGNKAEASAILANLRRFDPDDPAVLGFIRKGVYAGQRCSVE